MERLETDPPLTPVNLWYVKMDEDGNGNENVEEQSVDHECIINRGRGEERNIIEPSSPGDWIVTSNKDIKLGKCTDVYEKLNDVTHIACQNTRDNIINHDGPSTNPPVTITNPSVHATVSRSDWAITDLNEGDKPGRVPLL